MSVTTTTPVAGTLGKVLDEALPGLLASALLKVKLGTVLTPKKLTLSSLTASATHDITDAAHGSNPAVLAVSTLRVTAVGTGATGARKVTDVGGTPSATLATLSDDGKTLVFEGTVTGFVLAYVPRSDVDPTALFSVGR